MHAYIPRILLPKGWPSQTINHTRIYTHIYIHTNIHACIHTENPAPKGLAFSGDKSAYSNDVGVESESVFATREVQYLDSESVVKFLEYLPVSGLLA